MRLKTPFWPEFRGWKFLGRSDDIDTITRSPFVAKRRKTRQKHMFNRFRWIRLYITAQINELYRIQTAAAIKTRPPGVVVKPGEPMIYVNSTVRRTESYFLSHPAVSARVKVGPQTDDVTDSRVLNLQNYWDWHDLASLITLWGKKKPNLYKYIAISTNLNMFYTISTRFRAYNSFIYAI